MDTETLVITDLLNCGSADISMLDILYSNLADDIDMDSQDILQEAVSNGGLNTVLDMAYTEITQAIVDKLNNIISEYKDTLEDGKTTEDTYNTELNNLIDLYNEEGEFIGLTEEQLEEIQTNIDTMENSYPYCNCIDSHFQNDLDQTLDEDAGVFENCRLLLEYWLK